MPPKPRGGSRIKKEGQPDVYRIGGQEIPCDPDLDYDKPKPTPLYPEYKVSPPKPLTEKEKIQIARFRSLRESIHNGPLYTILGESRRVTKPGERPSRPAATFNAFEAMPKYSQKYTKQRRMIPKLNTRPYVLKFFPEELHKTLGYTADTANGAGASSSTKHKTLTIPGYEKVSDEPEGSGDEGDEKAADEDDPLMGEEVDDEFEDDEDGGDYNAEQYFDDGGDDAGDDYDGGGDDGGGGYID